MTWLFEAISPDDYFYVNAPDLDSALKIFYSHYENADLHQFHIYIRIV